VQPDCPEDLEAIVSRALEKRPEDRYTTAGELLEDLEAHIVRRDDSMSMREVGAIVGRAFAEERRRMTALIEETLTRVRNGPRSGVMPTLDLPSWREDASQVSSHVSSHLTSRNLPSMSVPPAIPSLGPTPIVPERTAWWASRPAMIAASGAAVVVLLAVVALVATPRESAPAARPDPLPVAAAAPAPREAPDLVDVVVRVSPTGAQVTIDGTAVPSNPFHARYAKDSLVHHVAASAEGYEPKAVDVTFVNDTSVDLSLDRRAPPPMVRYIAPPPPPPVHAAKHAPTPGPASAPPNDAPPPPAPAPRTDVAPTGGHAPLRPIMTNNPYGNQ
jgi:hypothetical protein